MNLNINKKKISHSIINKEISLVNYQILKTSWKQETNNEQINDLHKKINFQEILKQKINSNNNGQTKNKSKNLGQTIFNNKSKVNNDILLIKQLKNNNTKIIGALNLSLSFFNNKSLIDETIKNELKNTQTVSFWFIQLKSFFFKMPQNNISSWKIKQESIYSCLNFNCISNFNIFNINKKLKTK